MEEALNFAIVLRAKTLDEENDTAFYKRACFKKTLVKLILLFARPLKTGDLVQNRAYRAVFRVVSSTLKTALIETLPRTLGNFHWPVKRFRKKIFPVFETPFLNHIPYKRNTLLTPVELTDRIAIEFVSWGFDLS